MDNQCVATLQRLLTKAQSSRCFTWTSTFLRLSYGTRRNLRVNTQSTNNNLVCLFVRCHHLIFIVRWLQIKWNSIIAPLVRELSMNKCIQPKSKATTAMSSSLLSTNSLEIGAPYESVACTALYVLLHRAVSRDCPLIGQGTIVSLVIDRSVVYLDTFLFCHRIDRDQYLLNFIGSRLEGANNLINGRSLSTNSSAASSRTSTPQVSDYCDFVSIQLE
jgi:hypothetical protein